VFCRILTDGEGAEWPLSRKFGCAPEMAVDVLRTPPASASCLWRFLPCRFADDQPRRLGQGAADARHLRGDGRQGHRAQDGQYGRRLPDPLPEGRAAAEAYGRAIFDALRKHFGNRIPETIIEPGRGMVGNAGVIKSEVVLVSKKSAADDVRWVYLDIGKFGGLAETMDEAIRYPIRTPRDMAMPHPAFWPARPATPPTCSTRRPLMICRSR
jgi:ornithine decarboxylase